MTEDTATQGSRGLLERARLRLPDRRARARRRDLVLAAIVIVGAAWAVAAGSSLDPAWFVRGAVVSAALLAMLSAIVVVHELAHLVVGRLLGIRSDAFSVGFGPELVGITRGGIRWSWRAIPLGGYVRLLGETDAAVQGGLAAAGPTRIALVYLAGPVANLATAAAAAAVLAISQGVTLAAVPQAVAAVLWTALAVTARLIVEWIPTMLSNLAAMPFGGLPSMFGAMDQAVRSGPFLVTLLFVLLNLSIGLMNLIPLPPLDGGQAVLGIARARMGDRIPEAAVRRAVRAGFVGLMALMFAINVVDLVRWTVGGYTLGA